MTHLSVSATLLSMAPLLLALLIFQWQLGHTRELAIAAVRMVLQLVGIGYLLNALFTSPAPLLGLCVLSVMLLAASWIALRPLQKKSVWRYVAALSSLAIASVIHLVWIIFVVLQPAPWYQPQQIIPLAGMVVANGMNSLSLGAERLEAQIDSNELPKACVSAFKAAMIPQVNSLLAVGLVSLPGMMTGQILAGMAPLEAVRYQILVMSMIAGNASLTLALYFWQVKRNYMKQQSSKQKPSKQQSAHK
ncbi:ABC transporter permease [Teredinibacter turnerae]|uniref:ABC transporter permease n=1 Tax=Teredinibacter turnerae TaxID=2426 RepID=UPI00037C4019|nr:ABC transporter permease [Teredinibacter turnerae]